MPHRELCDICKKKIDLGGILRSREGGKWICSTHDRARRMRTKATRRFRGKFSSGDRSGGWEAR